jgi:nitrous oxidase accessory protein NosD
MAVRRTFAVLTLALGLTLGLLVVFSPLSPVRADPGDLFVKPDGSGTACSRASPCALQAALDQAGDGDTIYVAGGTYTGTGAAVITVTKSITLYGGWDGAASGPVVRDPAAYPTLLDGEGARRVIYISGDITPTLDGFIIARGNGTGLVADCYGTAGNPDGCGGGIFVSGAHPLIVNNVITNSVAAITTAGYPTSTTGYGGGIYLYQANNALISGNTIISNTGSLAYYGNGGGICIRNSNSVQIRANRVLSNTATSGTGWGWGGGIAVGGGSGSVEDNEIAGNWAKSTGAGSGSGLYQWYDSTTFRRNRVTGNHGSTAVYLGYSNSLFESNQVIGNPASYGVYLTYSPGPVLVNNIVAGSQYAVQAFATAANPLTAKLFHNTLVGTGSGRGVTAESGYVTLILINNIVVSHAIGISNTYPASSTISADHTLFWGNASDGIVGTNPVYGDPRFLNPAGGNYHLGPGSAAIDAGVTEPTVHTDIDGDPRPIGAGYDIGADERRMYVYLPLVLRQSP